MKTKIIPGESKYEVRMKGLAMDLNLEITPEAQVQLIFDPVIGDILKGRGSGNLKIGVNTLGKFEIFGDILIENGDSCYLFTLQNVINKKFEVKPGGRISWNGDPADANIELETFYSYSGLLYIIWPWASIMMQTPLNWNLSKRGFLLNVRL